jgi:hypothetical protein
MPEVEPTISEEEFKLKTGETIRVTKYLYEFEDNTGIAYYDIFMRTPLGMSSLHRAAENWDNNAVG